MTSRKF